ncbi:MAG: signal transduction histidine kinase [Solidesulfovibrio magneticus str. Maddingley MBC34]|uniref:histidine kinase n=1 Tax=Solidesulfovibrio magneticus str. Maddingley MBC34 TaxID=1206767 RepID=K6HF14_9BACT|nr:MAG: signal transduction histidine kinase [Solidesulfovibrio magneticus str. Maddingley MBC34]
MIATKLLRSSTLRLSILHMAAFGLSVLVLLWFIYSSTAGFMERQTDETINAEIQGLAEQYSQLGLTGLIRVIKSRVAKDKAGSSVYLLTDWKFNPLAGNLPDWPKFKDTGSGWFDATLEDTENFEPRRVRMRYFLLPGNFHLVVGRDVSERIKVERLIVDALIWGMLLTVVLGGAGGVLTSRWMLKRIDVITKASREIMNGDLTRRIPTRGAGDEFDRLAENLNAMLDQIGRLMDGVKQVSNNIAHDLRGPLNRIRSGLEITLARPQEPEACRQALERAITEIDGLLQTFNALLTIAQAESGARRQDFTDIDLTRLAADAAELYEPVAEEAGLSLEVDLAPQVTVPGNRHLLSQALANLLDNAVKYTPGGGRVTLSLTAGPAGPELTVADTGPGIPAEHREFVLERFTRLESSRNTPGSGLGLSLVAAAAGLHQAELRLGDNRPGLRVTLAFPAGRTKS